MSKGIHKKEDMQVGQIKPKYHYEIINTNSNEIPISTKSFLVTFRITEACDLHCNYCHWHSGRHYKFDDILTSIDKLFQFFQNQKFNEVVFYYHGGEATRHTNIVEILEYVKKKSNETKIVAHNEMQTNLTLKEETLKKILPLCDQINISLHYLELKERENKFNSFKNNFNLLKSLGMKIHNFDIMLENIQDDKIDEFYEYILECLSYDKIVNSEMIYGFCHYAYNEKTSEKHLEFYKKYNKTEQLYKIDGVIYNTNDLFKKGIDNRGWHCAAGTQSITINGNGDVFHCGIHMTNHLRECIEEKPFTNLVSDSQAITKMNILYKTGTICRWDYCGGDFYLRRTPPK